MRWGLDPRRTRTNGSGKPGVGSGNASPHRMSAVHALTPGVGLPAAAVAAAPDEASLVRRAQAGDLPAFDELVRHHMGRALRVARRLVPTQEDA